MLSLSDIPSNRASLRLSMQELPKPLLSIAMGSRAKTQNTSGKMQDELTRAKNNESPLFSSPGFLGEGGLASFACLFSVVCCSTGSKYTSRSRIVFHMLVDV